MTAGQMEIVEGSTVGAQLVGDYQLGCEALLPEQLAHEPQVGDVDPPGNPGVTAVGNMPEDPVEGADAAGPPDHPQMQSDRHHFRRVRPLAMQPVEGVDDGSRTS